MGHIRKVALVRAVTLGKWAMFTRKTVSMVVGEPGGYREISPPNREVKGKRLHQVPFCRLHSVGYRATVVGMGVGSPMISPYKVVQPPLSLRRE